MAERDRSKGRPKRGFVPRPGEFSYQQREAARRSPCAFCGTTADAKRGITVDAHHPIPLEWVGDSIKQTPVPLCRGGNDGGCHPFFDALVYDNKVTYQEYVEDIKKISRRDRPGTGSSKRRQVA